MKESTAATSIHALMVPEEDSSHNNNRSWWQSILFLCIFLIGTPLALITSVIGLVAITNTTASEATQVKTPKAYILSSAGAGSDNSHISMSGQVLGADVRVSLIERYLRRSNSELLPYAEFIVKTSDKYGLDYRLIPAIAQKESGLCRVIPHGSHNCWGWGIHSKGTLMFDSYDFAIETVSKGLKEKYIDKGYVTTDQIMKKYAHPDSTTWADGVNAYMEQIERPLLSEN
jgi:hypothetical protein